MTGRYGQQVRYPSRLVLPATLLLVACGAPPAPITWTPLNELNFTLPDGVEVFEGVDFERPLRAWHVRVAPEAAASVHVVQSSDEADRRETVPSFAERHGACIAVNGGYFSMARTPAVHAGLLVEDGVMRAAGTQRVTRDSVEYPAVRATLGFTEDRGVDIEWTTSSGDTVFAWDEAPANRQGRAATLPPVNRRRVWPVRDALAAGPLLVRDGREAISTDEEVFFGSSIPDVHPRTAAGYTSDGTLLLVVVDGRQAQSRGVDLVELAEIMIGLGATEALNLDGGGSSTMVVGGRVMNRPAGGTTLREVMSAIVVKCGS